MPTKPESLALHLDQDQFIALNGKGIEYYYELLKVIEQGTSFKVWRAIHKATGLQRTIKVIRKINLKKEEQQKLFTEIAILRIIDHPNIIKLLEVCQDETSYYLIKEDLQGGTLSDKLKLLKQMPEKMSEDIIKQVLSALFYIHEKGILHRDINLDNLTFVNQNLDSQVKISNLSYAKCFDQKSKEVEKCGQLIFASPEIIKQNYNEKTDIWSCGVILFMMISGKPPFRGIDDENIQRNILRGNIVLEDQMWMKFSDQGKDFLIKLLTVDPIKRPSAGEALRHPWMIMTNDFGQNVSKRALQNLAQFKAKSIIKKAIITFMVNNMSSQAEIEQLQRTFQSLDTNNDGQLCREELIQGYTKILKNKKKAEEEVERILRIVDVNLSGKIDFTEFLMAAVNQERIFSSSKIQAAFKILDQNGDGFIQKQEFELLLGKIEQNVWDEMMQCNDKNEDGKISFLEFKTLLTMKE